MSSHTRTIAVVSLTLILALPRAAEGEDLKPVGEPPPTTDTADPDSDKSDSAEGDEDEPADESTGARLETDAEPTVGVLPVEDPTLDTSGAKELGRGGDDTGDAGDIHDVLHSALAAERTMVAK